MARFSDLPNELIINIWGYVFEPKSVENFALVSKKIYEVATPFVEEHNRLRGRYAKISDLDEGKHGRAAGLLEAILLNPRVTLYINELQIRGWAHGWKDQNDSLQTQSYAAKTMDVFEDAIRSLSCIDPFDAETWVLEMRSGHEGPLLTLILIRLTELKKLEIFPGYSEADGSLNQILGDRDYPWETSAPHRLNEAVSQFPKSGHISDLVIKYCDIEYITILRLLRSTKNLKKFSYYERPDSFVDPYQICSELLKWSRQSLQRLCLEFDHEVNISEKNIIVRDAISRFETLVELEMDINFFIDSEHEGCNVLMEKLPTSIEMVTFSGTEAIAFERVEGAVLQMIKHKVLHLPNLIALTFEQIHYLGSHYDTVALMTRIELCYTKLFAELTRLSAEVEVLLSVMTEPEYPDLLHEDNWAAFQMYMS